VGDAYGEFSNFAPYPIQLLGKMWPTTEHYFQAQKFAGTEHEETIRLSASPLLCAQLGRDRSKPLRADWEDVKESLMRGALHAKFTQYPSLKSLLLSTGDAILIEHTASDAYWGDAGDGTGRNRLGVMLMELRARLRGEAANESACSNTP
jgi:ribA/ribD-fused uncharacterized protein